jgi:hypothetical protein
MVHGKNMPPEWIGDWPDIGKTTPVKTRQSIKVLSKEAQQQCRQWAKRIMAVLDTKETP